MILPRCMTAPAPSAKASQDIRLPRLAWLTSYAAAAPASIARHRPHRLTPLPWHFFLAPLSALILRFNG